MAQDGSANDREIAVEANNQSYLVQRRGSELHIGRQAEGTVLWQDETVPVADLPDAARSALESGDTEANELRLALDAIVQAYIQRGG